MGGSDKRNSHERRWFRMHWAALRAACNASLNNDLPMFIMQLGMDRDYKFCGPDEILAILKPVMDQLREAFKRWQEKKNANLAAVTDSASDLATSKVILCKPPVPVADMPYELARSTVSAWIRALNPGSAQPKYGESAAKPEYWPADIPFVPPSKPPKGYADWAGALRRILASMLRHVGEDPETYYVHDENQPTSQPTNPTDPTAPAPTPASTASNSSASGTTSDSTPASSADSSAVVSDSHTAAANDTLDSFSLANFPELNDSAPYPPPPSPWNNTSSPAQPVRQSRPTTPFTTSSPAQQSQPTDDPLLDTLNSPIADHAPTSVPPAKKKRRPSPRPLSKRLKKPKQVFTPSNQR